MPLQTSADSQQVFANAVTALAAGVLATAITTSLPFPISGRPSALQHAVDVTNYPVGAHYRYTLQIATSIVGPWQTVGFFETIERGKNLDGTPATESSGTWTFASPLPAVCFGRIVIGQLLGGLFATSSVVRF